MIQLKDFTEIWAIDFEFKQDPGGIPAPICLVGKEYRTKRILRLWEDELRALSRSPFPDESLLVSYYASAEMACFGSLAWPDPNNLLDLYVEFRNLTNNKTKFCGDGLLGALTYFGIPGITENEKSKMRQLAMRGGPWTDIEKQALLSYCESDVIELDQLLSRFEPLLDPPRALYRGEYAKSAAKIELAGVPIDVASLSVLRRHWDDIQRELIAEVDKNFRVFEGTTFKKDRFTNWLSDKNFDWPRTEYGSIKLDRETFSDMAKVYPEVEPLSQLRKTLSKFHLNDLQVGPDGRNRCLLSMYKSVTGRNQPSNSKFIFGLAAWLRSLIQPKPGNALAYIDWSQQEFGIAAALSRDQNMISAYLSNDPYLEFAKQAGAAPANATKASHGDIRELYKQCVLAVQYGMGPESLSLRIQKNKFEAKQLIENHKQTYSKFWTWSDSVQDYANLNGKLHTVFGWRLYTDNEPRASSLRNFPMQANGAELMRLACLLGQDSGVKICAPVHDAFLIEAPAKEIDSAVEVMKRAMNQACRIILDGFELHSESKKIIFPERYRDPRGGLWETVWELVQRLFIVCILATIGVHPLTPDQYILIFHSGAYNV